VSQRLYFNVHVFSTSTLMLSREYIGIVKLRILIKNGIKSKRLYFNVLGPNLIMDSFMDLWINRMSTSNLVRI